MKIKIILNLAWLFMAFLFICSVSHVAKSIDGLTKEVKRMAFAQGGARVFTMDKVERLLRQDEMEKQMAEMKRCVMVRFEGETPEEFLERTKDCPKE